MPLRVAQVVGKMVGGGVESVVVNYYRHIDRSRVQFDFIVDDDSTQIPEEIMDLGGRIFLVPPYQNQWAYQRALKELFGESRWEIVHSHLNALSVFPLHTAKCVGVPIRIAHSHSTAGKGEYVRNLTKNVLRRFSNLYPTHRLACSRYAGEWLFGKHALFEVVPNAIELSSFAYNEQIRQKMRNQLGIRPNQFVIGHVGRFASQKNHSFLVEVFARVARKRPEAVLVLVGTGDLLNSVIELIKARGLSDRVLLLGQRDDIECLYQAFDVFVLPSLYEGLGIVGIEAQRSGLPCIFSDQVPREVSLTGCTAFLPINKIDPWVNLLSGIHCSSRVVDPKSFIDYDINNAAKALMKRYELLFTSIQEGKC